MKNAPAFVLVILLLATCKANRHTVKDFEKRAKNHKIIAVLPFEFQYTGNPPAALRQDELESVMGWGSHAFGEILHRLLSADTSNQKTKIALLHPNSITQRLAEKGEFFELGIKASPVQLCKLMNVDAIVVSTIQTERLLAMHQSPIMPLHESIIEKVNPPPSPLNQNKPQIPGNANRSYRIKAKSTLINAADSAVLWQYTFETEAAWNDPAWTVINKVCKGLAKKFPYRNGPYGAN